MLAAWLSTANLSFARLERSCVPKALSPDLSFESSVWLEAALEETDTTTGWDQELAKAFNSLVVMFRQDWLLRLACLKAAPNNCPLIT